MCFLLSHQGYKTIKKRIGYKKFPKGKTTKVRTVKVRTGISFGEPVYKTIKLKKGEGIKKIKIRDNLFGPVYRIKKVKK